jgi:hypothetical protein
MALVRDPRSVKARYRRAMARRGLGNIPEALVDLASLLTTAPTHGEAMSAFAELLSVQNVPGSRRMSPENILAADFPPAYGSMSPGVASIQPSDSLRPVSDFTSWQDMDRLPPIQLSTCRTCKTTKSRDEIKTCQKVDSSFRRAAPTSDMILIPSAKERPTAILRASEQIGDVARVRYVFRSLICSCT